MSKVLDSIARENFRSSGYLTHPVRERRSRWTFSPPPRIPFATVDTVRDALQRRERAALREQGKHRFLQNCLHVLLHR